MQCSNNEIVNQQIIKCIAKNAGAVVINAKLYSTHMICHAIHWLVHMVYLQLQNYPLMYITGRTIYMIPQWIIDGSKTPLQIKFPQKRKN